jgi:hypothetical protein
MDTHAADIPSTGYSSRNTGYGEVAEGGGGSAQPHVTAKAGASGSSGRQVRGQISGRAGDFPVLVPEQRS